MIIEKRVISVSNPIYQRAYSRVNRKSTPLCGGWVSFKNFGEPIPEPGELDLIVNANRRRGEGGLPTGGDM